VLGAPLTHDFAVISLSDHLTPWPVIEKRIQFAAKGDFVMVLYNPQSRERKGNLSRAWEIMMRYKSPRTPAGIVKNASREGETVIITSLCDMLKYEVDMTTVIIVGNKDTFTEKGKMITPRGYAL
jgi:precorrin-3B C17-methyltransferase